MGVKGLGLSYAGVHTRDSLGTFLVNLYSVQHYEEKDLCARNQRPIRAHHVGHVPELDRRPRHHARAIFPQATSYQ